MSTVIDARSVTPRRDGQMLTRNFKDLVQRRAAQDPAFRQALLGEGIDTMLRGDTDANKAVQRDYFRLRTCFDKLGEGATATPSKS